ncbi:DUF6193 family natural product biosynthesis protein [Kitasatospora sp. NPDC004745]|uniref:DUF6193 family natural product biosynthesis protein n=1 Tax=Kitasatospora sp. NPDC004745 TaxID=3364019 RepID=UPI0036A5FCF0
MNDSDAAQPEAEDPVAAQWQLVREMNENRIDKHLVEAAYTNPALRSLFPLVGHGSLQFSRCTRFPWSQDLPSIFPLDGQRFRVLRLHEPQGSGRERIGGAFTAEEAVEIAAANLPAGWGPAVDGKPDVLEPLS